MSNGNTINIDKDIVDSLRGLFFGSYSNVFYAVGIRAYRDFNRTLSFGNYPTEKRNKLRTSAIEVLHTRFDELWHTSAIDQETFDEWHKTTANDLIHLYENESISFSYGQAQKWINMTAKYLYIAGADEFSGSFAFLHIPIDNYVMNIAFDKFSLKKPKLAWSKWDYDQYISYQNALRALIKNEDPLRWEFRNWLEAARDYVDTP